MIEGLMLTMTGEEVRELLDKRAEEHRQRAARWERERVRTPDQQTEEEPLLPECLCEHEAERFDWRADVLEFLRDHIDPSEVYRLGEGDLAFGELLPPKPGGVERLAKRISPSGGPEIFPIRREPDADETRKRAD